MRKNSKRGYMAMLLLLFGGLVLVSLAILGYLKVTSEQVHERTSYNWQIDSQSFSLKENETKMIFSTALYENGYRENVNEASEFVSSNPEIATVDPSGVVTGKKPGKTTIIIHYEGEKEEIFVSVSDDILQVNVVDFGAYGDGVHDDTEAFQQAIDTIAEKGGGDVFVPSGTYILHPITLKEHVNLVGEDRDSSILKLADNASNGQTRLIEMNHHTKIQSLTCDGNSQSHPNGSEHMHCIFVYDKDHILIENNRLMNAVGDGISISGSERSSHYVVISNNIVQENRRSQIVIEQVNHLRILNNTISSNTGASGIHFEPWEEREFYDAKIWGNTISTNSTGYASQLAGSDSESAPRDEGYFFNGIEFYQNSINAPNAQLLIEDTKGAKIHDNVLNVREVFIWRKNKDVNIYNNKIHAKTGFYIEGDHKGKLHSEGTLIHNNIVYSQDYGAFLDKGAKKTTISNNVFEGSGTGIGIKLYASEDVMNTIIHQNRIKQFDDGVDVSTIDDKQINELYVNQNTFTDINEYALVLTGRIHEVLMEANHIKNASGVHIYAEHRKPMSNISILHNTFEGGIRGIYQNDYGDASIKGLSISKNLFAETDEKNAAIELNSNSKVIRELVISENTLEKNNGKQIIVPKSLQKNVENNLTKERD